MIAEAFDGAPRKPFDHGAKKLIDSLLTTAGNAQQRIDYQPNAEGNAHYAKLAIDPFSYAMANKLDALQFTVIKYVTRFRDKGGMRDLQEAKRTIDRLIQHETQLQKGNT